MAARDGQARLGRWLVEMLERASVRGPARDRLALLVLGGLSLIIAGLSPVVGAEHLPPVVVVIPLLAGALVLRLRATQILIGVATVCVVFDLVLEGLTAVRAASVVVVAFTAAVSYRLVAAREGLGVPGIRAASMLSDLRDRIQAQGVLPPLADRWHAEVALRPAGGTSFGGDFLVSVVTPHRLEVALVDVSGKGVDAGTRALLLSGALGGLLGAVDPGRFLPAANDYLLRQGWLDGFATAVHLALDLRTGEYLLSSAGHPPAAHFLAGSGDWRLADAAGPALGLVAGAEWQRERGCLRPYDALLLYTDGVVEVAGRDLEVGIDKLLGEATTLVVGGFTGGADRLVRRVAPSAGDDRAVLLIWRDG